MRADALCEFVFLSLLRSTQFIPEVGLRRLQFLHTGQVGEPIKTKEAFNCFPKYRSNLEPNNGFGSIRWPIPAGIITYKRVWEREINKKKSYCLLELCYTWPWLDACVVVRWLLI